MVTAPPLFDPNFERMAPEQTLSPALTRRTGHSYPGRLVAFGFSVSTYTRLRSR